MWILTTLLVGLFTAAASDNAEKSRQRELDEALRQRLGLEPAPGTSFEHQAPPVEGGVPIWVWADGHRIVRIVTEPQMEEVYDQMSEKMLWDYEMSTAVMADDDDPNEPAWPNWSIFVYLDDYSRVHALLAFEGKEIQEFTGFGPGSQIEDPVVRSRMFQFLQDHDLVKTFDDDASVALWYDKVNVIPGFEEVFETVEAHLEDEEIQSWLSDLQQRYNPEILLYAEAYSDLYWAWRAWNDRRHAIDKLHSLDPDSIEFLDHMIDEDWGWRLEDNGFDIDEIRRAYEGDDDLRADLIERGLNLGSWHKIMLEIAGEDDDVLSELRKAAAKEAEVAGKLMSGSHEISRTTARNRHKWSLEIQWSLVTLASDLVARVEFHIDDNCPDWRIDGTLSEGRPGVMALLLLEGRLETDLELYNKAPEDTVWEWPGEELPGRLEAMFLLDAAELDTVSMSLPDFLTHSFEAGLLTPTVIDYWSPLLHSGLGADYSLVRAGRLPVDVFARKYGLRVMPRLPQVLETDYYDCGCHVYNWLGQRFSSYDHESGPKGPQDAKPGDMVHYDGLHYGVIVRVDPIVVESCWGIDGIVFQHPLNTAPYRRPMIYSLVDAVEK